MSFGNVYPETDFAKVNRLVISELCNEIHSRHSKSAARTEIRLQLLSLLIGHKSSTYVPAQDQLRYSSSIESLCGLQSDDGSLHLLSLYLQLFRPASGENQLWQTKVERTVLLSRLLG